MSCPAHMLGNSGAKSNGFVAAAFQAGAFSAFKF